MEVFVHQSTIRVATFYRFLHYILKLDLSATSICIMYSKFSNQTTKTLVVQGYHLTG